MGRDIHTEHVKSSPPSVRAMSNPYYPPGTYLLVYDDEVRFEPHGIDPGGADFIQDHGAAYAEKMFAKRELTSNDQELLRGMLSN